jgi:hypothetical protein
MERATQVFAAVSFLVIGLSHLAQPRAWVSFYQALAARGTTGAYLEGFLCLNFGAFVVAFHNVWEGPAIVLTLVGWAQVLKGLVRFVAPDLAVRAMLRATPRARLVLSRRRCAGSAPERIHVLASVSGQLSW